MIGWHITSRNRATQICLRGIRAGDYDNFGAFAKYGPQLMSLCGAKPVYVGVDGLCEIEPIEFSRKLHVGPQQLRAVKVDLDGLDPHLHVDLPFIAEKLRLTFKGERVIITGKHLPMPVRPQEALLHDALRRAAKVRAATQSVPLRALDDPYVREICMQATSSACIGQDIEPARVLGVYTVDQARTISDYERGERLRHKRAS